MLRAPLVEIYKAGWKVGELAAEDAINRRKPKALQTKAVTPDQGDVTVGPNWDTWTPGSIPGANKAKNLQQLISDAVGSNEAWSTRAAQRGNLLASIEDNRLNKLADAMSNAVAQGQAVDQIEGTLTAVLDDPSWANMVATTELARSMTQATLDSYLDAGVEAKSCATAQDGRVCLLCQANEDAGIIPIDEPFPNDDPPTHPGCRCAILPQWANLGNYLPEGQVTAQDIIDAEQSAEDLEVAGS